MIAKAVLLKTGIGILVVGVLGLTAVTVKDIFFPKPLDKELRQTKSMLRSVFDKNKDLTTEVDDLTRKHAEFLKEMEDKNKELAEIKEKMEKQAAYVKTLTKTGKRLEKEVSLKPIQRDYEVPRGADPVKMPYPNRREGKPEIKFPFKEKSEELPVETAVPAVESSPDAVVDAALMPEAEPPQPEPAPELPVNEEPVIDTSSDALPVQPMPASLAEDQMPAAEAVQPLPPQEVKAEEIKQPEIPAVLVETPPAAEKQPEPAREAPMIPEITKTYEREIAAFQAEIKKLREERELAEIAWRKKTKELETDLQGRLSKEAAAKLQSEVKAMQKRTEEFSEKAKKAQDAMEKDRVDYLYNLGVAYTQAGMFEAAADMYEKVLKINPEDAGSHYNLGILYDEHMNRPKEGMEHYKAYLAISKDPEKRRSVETWIRISQYDVNKKRETHFESGSKAAKHLLLTTPD